MMKRRFVSTFFAAASTIAASAISFAPADNSSAFYTEGSVGEQIFVGESDSAKIRVSLNQSDLGLVDVATTKIYLSTNDDLDDAVELNLSSPVATVGTGKCYRIICKTADSEKTGKAYLCYIKKTAVAPTVKACDYDSIENPICSKMLKMKFSNFYYANSYINASGDSVFIKDNITLSYEDYEANGLEINTKTVETVVSGYVNKDSMILYKEIQKPRKHTVFKLKDKFSTYEFVSDTFHTPLSFSTAQLSIEEEKIPHNTEKRDDNALAFSTIDEAKANVNNYVFSGPLKVRIERNSIDNTPADSIDATYEWKFYNDSTGVFQSCNKRFSNNMSANDIDIDEYGTHFVLLSSDNSVCKDTIATGFKMKVSYLLMPTVFTPNGDGANDEFRPTYTSLKEYRICIFNTMGKKMYESTDITTGWDGTHKGHDCPIGAYYYVVEAKGVDDIDYKLKGTVNLIRYKD